jgi:uncharacterized protein (DUF2249 family)
VLARDERLLDVLSAAAPSFETLRTPAMRRNMAPRVTVEQAAQIAGLDAAVLVDRLNRALGDGEATRTAVEPVRVAPPSAAVPAAVLATPPELLIDLDVREDLRSGREPFARIMGAVKALSPGQVLRLRAIFEPAPLYGVLAKKGYAHATEQLAADDWRVWFFKDEGARAAPAASVEAEEDVVVIDVRDLEPPEPMVRTFEALETLPRGKTLLQLNVRVPQFLLPKLEERGFVYEIREQSKDLVRLFIRHKQ